MTKKRAYLISLITSIIIISFSILFYQEQTFCAEEQEAINLVYGGDFEGGHIRADNLWDGVNRSNKLMISSNSAPAVVDINGDGRKDIICGDGDGDSGGGMLWYYLNSGTNESPQFTRAKFIKARFDANVKPIVVDWNGDGRKDIVFGSKEGRIYCLRNKKVGGSLEFFSPEPISVGGKVLDIGQFSAPAVADWNGDEKKDLILGEGTYSANSVYIYINRGSNSNPKFNKDSRQYLAYGEGRMHLTPSVVDWDKDGDLDLVVGDENGYINLYLNRAEKVGAFTGEKIKVLDYAGRIKSDAQEIDVGLYSTPCAVDWDGDGDWDIVSGSSSGYVYLILNRGTTDAPDFSQPMVLKGVDTYKPMRTPSYWTQDTKRKGAYYAVADEDAYSGKYALKVICYDNYEGEVTLTGSLKGLERDVTYKFTFYTKGKDVKGIWTVAYKATSERVIVDGRRRYTTIEKGWRASGEFKPSSSWKEVTSKFKLPKIHDKKLEKKLQKKKYCSLTFKIRGKGTIWIDEVSLKKR